MLQGGRSLPAIRTPAPSLILREIPSIERASTAEDSERYVVHGRHRLTVLSARSPPMSRDAPRALREAPRAAVVPHRRLA
jgi:hypothetical protein